MTKITILGWDVVRYPAQTKANWVLDRSRGSHSPKPENGTTLGGTAGSDVALTVCLKGSRVPDTAEIELIGAVGWTNVSSHRKLWRQE